MASEAKKVGELERATGHYLKQADAKRSAADFAFELNVEAVQRAASSTLQELQQSENEDKTPELQVVDDFQPLRWRTLIATLVTGCATAIANTSKPAAGESEEPATLPAALDDCDAEFKRLRGAISGNDADSKEAKRWRNVIFGERIVVRSRPGYDVEIPTLISTIRANKDCPSAVTRMIPRLEKVHAALMAVPPHAPGRKPKVEAAVVPVPVQVATLALNLALGDLVSHANTVAEAPRLAAIQRIVLSRRGGDSKGDSKAEGQKDAAKPGEGAKPDAAKPGEAATPEAAPQAPTPPSS